MLVSDNLDAEKKISFQPNLNESGPNEEGFHALGSPPRCSRETARPTTGGFQRSPAEENRESPRTTGRTDRSKDGGESRSFCAERKRAKRINEMRKRGVKADCMSLDQEEKYVRTEDIIRQGRLLAKEMDRFVLRRECVAEVGEKGRPIRTLSLKRRSPIDLFATDGEGLCLVFTQVARPIGGGEIPKTDTGSLVGQKRRVATTKSISVHRGRKGLTWKQAWMRSDVRRAFGRIGVSGEELSLEPVV